MEREDFYFLGRITKTSGYKGSLVFFFDVDDINSYKDLEAVFINIGQDLIPFAICNLTFKKGNTAFANLEEVNSEEEALALIGCELYLPLSFLPPLTGNKFYYYEVIGFTVKDTNLGNVGIIEDVMDQGSQALFVIKKDDKEILIPITDDIIVNVDRKSRSITVDAPEGLIDIYL